MNQKPLCQLLCIQRSKNQTNKKRGKLLHSNTSEKKLKKNQSNLPQSFTHHSKRNLRKTKSYLQTATNNNTAVSTKFWMFYQVQTKIYKLFQKKMKKTTKKSWKWSEINRSMKGASLMSTVARSEKSERKLSPLKLSAPNYFCFPWLQAFWLEVLSWTWFFEFLVWMKLI